MSRVGSYLRTGTRRAEDPLRVVLIGGLVGTVLLAVAYFGLDSLSARSNATATSGDVASSTSPVLSARRAPTTLSNVARTGKLRRALEATTARLPDASCLRVDWLGETITSTRATQAFVPASASKVATAAVALEVLGADHVFETAVYSDRPAGTAVVPTLYLVGGGDPSIVTPEHVASERYPTRNGTPLGGLIDAIVSSGVRQVTGAVTVVDNRYDMVRYVDSWPASFHAVEAGPLGALIFNDATVIGQQFKADDPALGAGTDVTTLLAQRGITIGGAPRRADSLPSGAIKIASVTSAPLSQVVTDLLVNSDNNTAELLLKEIGLAKKGVGSTAAGIAVVNETLATWSLTSVPVVGDGSGLSRINAFSCDNFVDILDRQRDVFPSMLAVAGQSGTLIDALEDTPAEGVMAAKTGTLTGVKSLVGYQRLENEDDVVFALVMNAAGIDNQRAYRPIWDSLADALGKASSVPRPEQLAP